MNTLEFVKLCSATVELHNNNLLKYNIIMCVYCVGVRAFKII